MATRTTQVTRAVSPAYDEASRRRMIADTLAAQSQAPREVIPGQTAGYLANGITQLGQALLARKAGKKADAAMADADAQMQDVNRAAIEKLSGAYQADSFDGMPAVPVANGMTSGSKLETALAGQDPRQANAVLAQALVQQALPKEQKVPEGYTLAPGQTRFGPDGKPVASVASLPQQEGSLPKEVILSRMLIDPNVPAEQKALIKAMLEKDGPAGPSAPSGYRYAQGGRLEYVPGGPADPGSPSNTRQDRGQITTLRKEFEGMDAVKNYKTVASTFERALTAPNTRAGDLSVVYALGKIFDPNSVVREGELTLSKDAQPWLSKLVNNAQSQLTGDGALDPKTRATLIEAMQGQVDSLGGQYAQTREQYGKYAQGYGVDPFQVVGDELKVRKPGAPAAPPAPGAPKESAADRAKRLGL